MKNLLRERFGALNATGRFWMWAGLLTLLCSMGMAFDYGSQVSVKHGLIMGALTLATAFIIEEAYSHWKTGMKGVAVGLTIVSVPLFWQESKSHIAYTAGFRGINVETANLQQTKYEDGRDDVEKAKATIAMFEKRLADLENQNGWAASATADSMRARLPGLELAITQETARGGCKTKCFERTRERDELQSRIATLEAKADYTMRIEAAKAVLSRNKEKVAAIEHKPSIVAHQNTTLFKMAALISSGNVEASPLLKEVVEQENTIGLALMPVMLPALCFFMMGLYRRKEDELPAEIETHTPAAPKYKISHTVAPSVFS